MAALAPCAAHETIATHATTTDIRSQFEEILTTQVPVNHFYSTANMRKLLEKYTEAELVLIYQDFVDLKEKTFSQATKALDYVVIAGGPAAGKSTVLESLMETGECPDTSLNKNIKRAYIDPDRSCLQHMERTYLADRASGTRTPQDAYTHWREASNFLSNVYLAVALDQGFAIAHGSTMATPHAKKALQTIKNTYNYHTTVVHMTCEEQVRHASEKKRQEDGVVQCTAQDFVEKQELFLTLLLDYANNADNLVFCYRSSMESSTWAAKLANKELTVYDQDAFDAIKQAHTEAVWQSVFPE